MLSARSADGTWDEPQDEAGATTRGMLYYIGGDGTVCGAGRQAGSSYCPAHHALCHIAKDSSEAGRVRREVAALAKAVGGRQGHRTRRPPDGFLKKLERVTRRFSRP